MSADLRATAAAHLAARRARGYRLEGHEHLLGVFLDSLEARGETRITMPAAVAFATAPAGTARAWHAQRLAAVRSFAGYMHALDPAAADPIPDGLIPGSIPRRVPYLYSGEETARLMAAAGTLASPVLAASMRTLIGLLADKRLSPACRSDSRSPSTTSGEQAGAALTISCAQPSAAPVLSNLAQRASNLAARATSRRHTGPPLLDTIAAAVTGSESQTVTG